LTVTNDGRGFASARAEESALGWRASTPVTLRDLGAVSAVDEDGHCVIIDGL
jgi:hypothetical protein